MVSAGEKSGEALPTGFGGGGRVKGCTIKLVTNSVRSGQPCSASKQGRYSICNKRHQDKTIREALHF